MNVNIINNKRNILILGAGGHGKVVSEIARLNEYSEIAFLDDNPGRLVCGKYPVLGKFDILKEIENRFTHIFIAVGNTNIRERLLRLVDNNRLTTLIHPKAIVSNETVIGKGSVVMAGSVINPGVHIGDGCIINTCASVDHDSYIGDIVHISVGVHISGTVNIGEKTWLGIGALVSNNVNICGNCMIGAGAVVIKDIDIPGTYIGIPAKIK